MRKFILSAALLGATISAKAQMSIETLYIGKTSIEGLKVEKINYKRYPQSETLVINDTTYTLDWLTREVVVDGDVYKMGENPIQRLAERSLTVDFDNRSLTLFYSEDFQRCIKFDLK